MHVRALRAFLIDGYCNTINYGLDIVRLINPSFAVLTRGNPSMITDDFKGWHRPFYYRIITKLHSKPLPLFLFSPSSFSICLVTYFKFRVPRGNEKRYWRLSFPSDFLALVDYLTFFVIFEE